MSNNKIIKVGVSSCLLGEKVRHDGAGKRHHFLTDVMSQYLEFVPCCPEVDIGLGIPRPTIHLIGNPKSPRLVQVRNHDIDLTEKMQKYASNKVKSFNDLCGYVLKKGSPSCGPSNIKVYQQPPNPPKKAQGIFAKILMETHPNIPVEDEGRLNDPKLRENFIQRIYLRHEWINTMKGNITPKKLVAFHTRHKLALMAHNIAAYQRLGQMIANIKTKNIHVFAENYLSELMTAFKLVANSKKNANVLYHAMGYLKNQLSPMDKKELVDAIEQYRQQKLPLVVCITLLRHHFMHYPNEYIANQSYLYPYPDEMMLRNNI